MSNAAGFVAAPTRLPEYTTTLKQFQLTIALVGFYLHIAGAWPQPLVCYLGPQSSARTAAKGIRD